MITKNFKGLNTLFIALFLSIQINAQTTFKEKRKLGSYLDQFGLSVATYDNGDYVIAGNLSDTIKLDKNTFINSQNAAIFIAYYNSKDSLIWHNEIKHAGSSNRLTIENPVVLDPSGSILISGSFTDVVRFSSNQSLSAGVLADLYLMKITRGGTVKYVKTYADAVNGALAVGKDGRVAIGGRKLYGDDEAFIAVYDSFGLYKTNGKLTFKGTSSNRDRITALAFSDSGDLYFAGKFCSDSIGYNSWNGTLEGSNDINRYSLFTGKFNSNYNLQWLKGATPIPGSRPYSFDINNIHVEPGSKKVYLTGLYDGANFEFNGDTLPTTSVVNSDARKPIIISLDNSGNTLWYSSLKLNSENQRGQIYASHLSPNGLFVIADIEHYLFSDLQLGDITFKWGEQSLAIIELDSAGKILNAISSNPPSKYTKYIVNNCDLLDSNNLYFSLIYTAKDTMILDDELVDYGSYIFHTINCDLKANITSSLDSICINSNNPTINVSPTGGKFKENYINSNGELLLESLNAGTYKITYEVSDETGCTASANTEIKVNPITEVSFSGLDSVYCPKDTLIVLKPNVSGGKFEGTGINSINFNPINAGTGIHTITYKYTNEFGCVSNAENTVRVKSQLECQPNEIVYSDLYQTKIYPNPNYGKFYVEVDPTLKGSKLLLINSLGQIQYESILDSNILEIDAANLNLSTGIWLIQITSESRIIFTQKVILMSR